MPVLPDLRLCLSACGHRRHVTGITASGTLAARVPALPAALVVLALMLVALIGCHARSAPPLVFTPDDAQYPVLFAGQGVSVSSPVWSLGQFLPAFGGERQAVNPALPRLEGSRRIVFDLPGEYYLHVNDGQPLKVVVLDAREPISAGVVRIFDFSVANIVFCDGDDPDWALDQTRFVSEWFRQEAPAALLCGPTADVFQKLVYDRFRLPSRVASFPGFYRRDGTIYRSSHNVPEVYLPDIGRFVMFDVNNALLVRWLGAMDIAERINASLDERAILSSAALRRLHLDIYPHAPSVYKPVTFYCNPDKKPGFVANARLVTRVPVNRHWTEDEQGFCPGGPCFIATWFYGGVAYFNAQWSGTAFLPGYTYASLHRDPALTRAAVSATEQFGVKPVLVVSQAELRRELDRGFAAQIEARPWLARLPADADARATLRADGR
jgi:hypothetical protein